MSFIYWGSGGNHGRSTDGQAAARRSVWTREGADSYRVTLQRARGEGWEDEVSIVYVRVR
jgi:hypothetical protein